MVRAPPEAGIPPIRAESHGEVACRKSKDYERRRLVAKPETNYPETTADEVVARMRAGEAMVLLDVRTMSEFRAYHIPGAVHIPIDELALRYSELDAGAPTVVVCEHGVRSAIATHFLRHLGFEGCINMRHGMSDWRGPVEGLMSYALDR